MSTKAAPSTPDTWRSRIVGHADVAVEDVIPHPLNWRLHLDHQRSAVDGSLGELGWIRSVLVNKRTGHLLDGHLRLALAIERHEPNVPVEFVDVSEEEERLILATLDPMAALAGEDPARLQELLAGIQTENAAILTFLRELGQPSPSARAEPDAVPELPTQPIAQPGELWALGAHRIFCGDMTVPENVAELMDGEKAACFLTDPPYAIYGSSTGIGSDIADDKMVRPFFLEVLRAAALVTEMFGHVYICCDWRSWPSWWEMAKRAGLTPKNCIVWDKGGSGLGASYANTYELVGFFALLPKQTVMTSNARRGQRQVFASNVWRGNRVSGDRLHNAQKPTLLLEFLLANSTDQDDLVLDPFLGSGSTLIAAEKLGRRCYGLEIDPKYVDVAVKRWEDFTGKKAILQSRELRDATPPAG